MFCVLFPQILKAVPAIEIAASLLSLFIVARLLFVSRKLRKSGQKEDAAFRCLIYTVAVFSFIFFLGRIIPVFVDLSRLDERLLAALMLFRGELPGLFSVIVALEWLVFVDFSVYHSPDSVRRRYAPMFIPILLVLVMNLLSVISSAAYLSLRAGNKVPESLMLLVDNAGVITRGEIFVCTTAMTAYMLYAYRIMHTYEKEMEQPVFLRLNVFIIPWFGAFVLYLLFLVSLYPLSYGLALVLTLRSMRNRYRFLHESTGFYNEDSLVFLASHMDKTEYGRGCAILFKTEGKESEAAKLLTSYKPEKSIFVQMGEGIFLLFASISRKPVVSLLMETVEMGGARMSPPINVKTRCWDRHREEDSESFLQRVVAESKTV